MPTQGNRIPKCDTGGYPTVGAYQSSYSGGLNDVTLTKFNPGGTAPIYSTYLGGQDSDQPHSLIVNSDGELIVFGRTNSSNFPTTPGAFDRIKSSGFDMFVTKFTQDGSDLAGSTFIGGSGDDGVNGFVDPSSFSLTKYNYGDDARGEVITDEEGAIYIGGATQSFNLNTIGNPFQPTFGGIQDGFVAKLSPGLNQMIWSTFLGGSGEDAINAIKRDQQGNVYVVGGTASSDVLATPGVITPNFQGEVDGFIAKINPDGQSLVAYTYFGQGGYDQIYLLDFDKYDDLYVTGQTENDFSPINPPAGPVYYNNNAKQFVVKLSNDLTDIDYLTTIGSQGTSVPNISPTAMLVDICENVYVSGWGGVTNRLGNTLNMPLAGNPQQSSTDGSDFYLFVLSRDAQELQYATYLGGMNNPSTYPTGEHVDGGTSRFDKNGIIYHAVCAACGESASFPTTPGVFSATAKNDNCNLALFKLAFDLAGVQAEFVVDNQRDTIVGCAPFQAVFVNRSYEGALPGEIEYEWSFGLSGLTSNLKNPIFEYPDPGIYDIRLVITDSLSCNISDTTFGILKVLPPPIADAGLDTIICNGEVAQLSGSGGLEYSWAPESSVENPLGQQTLAFPLESTVYTLTIRDEFGCEAIDQVQVDLFENFPVEAGEDQEVCQDETVVLAASAPSGNIVSYQWSPQGLVIPNNEPEGIAIPSDTTVYTVVGTDINGCESEDSVVVNVPNPSPISLDGVNKSCISGMIELQAEGAEFYVWSTGDTTLGLLEVPVPVDPLWYQVTGFVSGCPTLSDSILISEDFDYPKADFSFSPETGFAPAPVQFTNLSEDAVRYEWNFGFGNPSYEENPFFGYPFSGTYEIQLVAFNSIGCTDTMIREIIIDEIFLYIPDAFSPNQDNVNDEFLIVSQGIETMQVRIFSRWGMEVFYSDEIDMFWDGMHRGKGVPEGVYVYQVLAEGFNGRTYKETGTITLIR